MFTSTTTSREKALVAVAATLRAMERHVCCKSQFKFKCFSCGEFINRGDSITKCYSGSADGMTLRFRGADSRNGLTFEETAFYQAETGTKKWVHVGCNPCYWESLPEDSNEYSPPGLRGIPTAWDFKVEREFKEWCDSLPAHVFRSFPLFCQTKGYPYPKSMKDSIIHAVTRFQALWRGYHIFNAYPAALLDAQAEQMYPSEMVASVWEEIELSFTYMNQKSLCSGEGGENGMSCCNPPTEAQYLKEVEEAKSIYSYNVGDHFEALFNANEPSESVYSAEVIEIQHRGREDIKFKVKYHYDGEVRKYTGKKFKLLKKECEEHKRKLGIEAKLTGRIHTARIGRMIAVPLEQTRPSIQDWRYHYPDGGVVE